MVLEPTYARLLNKICLKESQVSKMEEEKNELTSMSVSCTNLILDKK